MGLKAPHHQKRNSHAAPESDQPSQSAIAAVLTAKKSVGEHRKVPPLCKSSRETTVGELPLAWTATVVVTHAHEPRWQLPSLG